MEKDLPDHLQWFITCKGPKTYINIIDSKEPIDLRQVSPQDSAKKEQLQALANSALSDWCDVFGTARSPLDAVPMKIDYKIRKFKIHPYPRGMNMWYFDINKRNTRYVFHWFM